MMTAQNQCTNPYGKSFSAAAAVAPIVLWSGHSQGNLYLSSKNTFLEFYTDERKAIKRSAVARSASCDSCFKEVERTSTRAPSSPSPSYRSVGSSDGTPTAKAETRSPDSPPSASRQNMVAISNADNNNDMDNSNHHSDTNYYNNNCYNMNYQYHDGNYYDGANFAYDNQYYHEGSYDCYDYGGSPTLGGYPLNQAMMMVPSPMPMPCVQEQQEMAPKVIKPHLPTKKIDLREANPEPVTEITTLMIRGIPCSFSQDTLLKLIDNVNLEGKYDFFYLPRAGNHGSNLGYAFVNFVDAESAEHFVSTFNGVPLDPSRSMKVCTISPGDIQGLSNLRKHFRRTAVSRGSRGPVFLKVFSDDAEDGECEQ